MCRQANMTKPSHQPDPKYATQKTVGVSWLRTSDRVSYPDPTNSWGNVGCSAAVRRRLTRPGGTARGCGRVRGSVAQQRAVRGAAARGGGRRRHGVWARRVSGTGVERKRRGGPLRRIGPAQVGRRERGGEKRREAGRLGWFWPMPR